MTLSAARWLHQFLSTNLAAHILFTPDRKVEIDQRPWASQSVLPAIALYPVNSQVESFRDPFITPALEPVGTNQFSLFIGHFSPPASHVLCLV